MHFLTFVVTKNGPDDYGYEKELEDALDPFYEGNCQPNEVYSSRTRKDSRLLVSERNCAFYVS